MHRYQCRQTPPHPPIDHRSMEDHYTKQVSHIEECTDTTINHTSMEDYYTSADRPHAPPQINHRSMEDNYTD